ncbi:Uma2 family endonuclease [Actinocorallia sp. A-T 12471]|uniref:Uma2 family endonuclease n=1 Tax=Actinocorallia sp. A-T 12471 TaxID=3089813 RepID=UPI0029D3BB96|nr:Uma2 family endonuclease [Actinocorallia sp. A-T 12471]MDX6743801.1 Uma2 family endonuclease [Actinocorallia sp. A-T 12471]
MTARLADGLSDDDRWLLDAFLRMGTPEGFRVELVEGEFFASPPPSARHERAVSAIVKQVVRNSAVDMSVSGNLGLRLRAGGGVTPARVIPDVVLAPEELDLFDGEASWTDADGVAMVVEVTSRDAYRDRVLKCRAYARTEIPLYLLVDRDARTVSLLSEPDPAAAAYTKHTTVAFGKTIALPHPFGFDLETVAFD